jgi:hypothetical protein
MDGNDVRISCCLPCQLIGSVLRDVFVTLDNSNAVRCAYVPAIDRPLERTGRLLGRGSRRCRSRLALTKTRIDDSTRAPPNERATNESAARPRCCCNSRPLPFVIDQAHLWPTGDTVLLRNDTTGSHSVDC